MRRSLVISLVAAVVAALCAGLTTASAAQSAGKAPDRLDAYTAVVQAADMPAIAQQGIDVSGQRRVANGIELEMVLDQAQADQLRGKGVDLKLTRVKGGLTVQEFAAEQAANGFNVWRSYDEAGGIRDQLYAAARNNPQLVKLRVLGHTGQGREIIAVKLTQGALEQPDGRRPAVLYSSTQHAREWISTEVNRRLMNHYIDRWRANDR
ncbi:MAG: M14 family zinc carboxypeptidase, partial [Kribbellaceae bacterium]